ncbi:DUF992 domain-containing protein [Hansschlegelia plantiphila]|uniref:DUF992 domain-containing protein n=1 Tax=Hansschlegelia plantiphila TaxID=374655 RepID=A0A9W6MTT4_9HYPH|nr:DUF992 domain-containing protein [Hansschlegelia plantiphila]GLK66684.1 hypothetical protein GCM10008179_03220 [Hansschlegelia plantiphila]
MHSFLKATLLATGCLASGAALAADIAHPSVTVTRRYTPVSGYQVGTLRCETASSIGYVVGSRRDVSCVYRPAAGRNAVDLYMGHVNKIGVDVGAQGPGVMAWAVIAHSDDLGPGDLAGKYRGASASAAALIGAGASLLVGGSAATISLQPLSVEGQTGLSVTAGYSSLTLDPI